MAGPRFSTAIRRLAVLSVLGAMVATPTLVVPLMAQADSAPPAPSAANPTTVSADPLPTVQINGVVWAQVAVGNTVYVAGSFTRARPAGSPAGANQTVRNNILAYDIRTGELITSFAPSLNAQALAITASPDGQRIYVGGDFTRVDGQVRNRIAALTPSGSLVAGFAPSVNGQVRAIAATNDTVYIGGSLSAVGVSSRNRLAAVSASNGAVLPWAPVPGVGPTSGNRDGNTATSNVVLALVVTGGGSQVVAAGRFDTMNGAKATGVAALDPVTGANRPFAVNQLITNQGVNSAIYSLSTDGTTVYGSGYDYYGPGNVEGTFAATANGGALVEINDCRGDSYATFPMHDVLYVASHTHNCWSIGGTIEQNPRVEKRGTAYTTTPTTKVRWGTNVNWVNKPAGTQVAWNPTIDAGSYTGQYQGSWSVTGNGQYISFGGEFPRVNGVAQQGLVRFAMPNVSGNPNRVGPTSSGFAASVAISAPGVARVSWPETWDMDNEYLTYRVYRDSDAVAPIYTATRPSRWFNLDWMGYSDTGQSGSRRYRVTATDPFGNSVATSWVTVTVPAGNSTVRPYVSAVQADGALDLWSMNETSGTAYSVVGGNDLTVGSGVSRGAGGAINGDPNTAFTFNGASSGVAASQRLVQSPDVFTIEAWFRTSSTSGGKILGFGDRNTGTSATYDRHIYMDGAGRVFFGVTELNQRRTIQSSTGFNDNAYHHVAATLGPAGMQLYLDGVRVANRTDITFGPNYYGYWRVGGDATWAGSQYFNGRIDEVAIYPSVLSQAQLANHHALATGGSPVNVPPTASFTRSATGLTVNVNGTGSVDPDGSIVGYAWNFGDGSTATGSTASHTYASGGTYAVRLTVTDNDGATGTTVQNVTVTGPPQPVPPTAAFTYTTAGLTANVDGSTSTDPGGSIVDHAWDFGDGATATGPTASRTYAAAGTYPVTLTVTDNDGMTGSVTRDVTVSEGPAPIALDGFERTVTNGLGNADIGGAWTVSQGATRQSVSGGAAQLTLPSAGNNTGSYLGSVSATNVNVLTSFSLSSMPTGIGTYLYVTGRRVGSSEYRMRVRVLADGRVALALSVVAGGETFPAGELIVPGVTYAPNSVMNVRVGVSGTSPTTVTGTVWPAGAPEPAAPQMTVTSSTAALQAAGSVGLLAHRPDNTTAATTVRVTDFATTAG